MFSSNRVGESEREGFLGTVCAGDFETGRLKGTIYRGGWPWKLAWFLCLRSPDPSGGRGDTLVRSLEILGIIGFDSVVEDRYRKAAEDCSTPSSFGVPYPCCAQSERVSGKGREDEWGGGR